MLVIENIPVIVFKEDDVFIAYTPALDLSTCGNTLEEANANIDDAIRAVLEEAIKDHKLEQVLTHYGWRKGVKDKHPQWLPPTVVSHNTHAVKIPVET